LFNSFRFLICNLHFALYCMLSIALTLRVAYLLYTFQKDTIHSHLIPRSISNLPTTTTTIAKIAHLHASCFIHYKVLCYKKPLARKRCLRSSLVLRRRRFLLNKPLHDTLVTKNKLSQTLHHTDPLPSEFLDGLFNQIYSFVLNPVTINFIMF